MHRLLTGSLTVERVTVPIANLVPALDGCCIVQLSDFHWDGVRLSPWLVDRAIDITNDLKPDLIALTGDFVTKEADPIWRLLPYLERLQARSGVVAVLGNHDIWCHSVRKEVTDALTSIAIPVLWGETIYPFGDDLPVVGLQDFWSSQFDPAPLLNALDPDQPRLVLSHNPDSAAKLQPWRVDLQLSGHTHGGQVVVPGVGPLPQYLPKLRSATPPWLRSLVPYLDRKCQEVVRHWEWSEGLHQLDNGYLYVNRGLGTYRPGRWRCPPEVTAVTLQRSDDSDRSRLS